MLRQTCFLLLSACGARTGLVVDSGIGGGGGAGAQGGGGSGPGGGPPACLWELASGPVEVMSFPDRQLNAPQLAVLDPGGSARLALVAFAGGGDSPLHPDLQLARLRLDGETVAVDAPAMLFGPESHGWGELAHAPGGANQIAMAWYSDPGFVGRVAFRTLDVASWSPGSPVDVSFDGEVAMALAAGAGVGPFGVGHVGDGYAIAWRRTEPPDAETRIAILDPSGAITLGPHAQGIPAAYPGHGPAMVWSGERYLIATGFQDCSDPAGCTAKLALERVRPASGDELDDSGIDFVWGLDPPGAVFRPSLDARGGAAWVSWPEGGKGEASGRRALRLRALLPQGDPAGDPVEVAPHTHPKGRAVLRATGDGLALAWGQDGDLSFGGANRGRSLIVVQQLGTDGLPARSPLGVPATQYDTYGPLAVAGVESPRGLVLAWSGRSETTPMTVIHAAFLRCREATPCRTSNDCSSNEFCAAPCCGEGGLCTPKPDGCFADCPGVTACGGEAHCNECEANVTGAIVPAPSCPSALYHAAVMPPAALDRVEITKAEPLWDICLRLVIAGGAGAFPGVAVSGGWGLEQAGVRKGAADCAEGGGPFDWIQPDSATGSIGLTFGTGFYPCSLDVDVALTFAPGEPWVPVTAGLGATALKADGCY